MTLGNRWRTQLTQKPLSAEATEDRQDLLDAVHEYETKAKDFLAEIKSEVLPDSINSCIARQSASCAIEMPAGVLTTQAFADFRDEVLSAGLIFTAGSGDVEDEDSVYLVFTYAQPPQA